MKISSLHYWIKYISGPDGKLLCTRCKKNFSRERVFNAHKCSALSEYVDFTAKEGLTEDPGT